MFMADLQLTSTGDLTIANGDFVLCPTPAAEDSQVIMARVLTNSPDWYCQQAIGANFEDLRGQVSSQQTANTGAQNIISTLTFDGYFSAIDLTVVAVPESGKINFFISADDDNATQPIVVNYPVSL
jgi:hypothetical protein